MTASPIPAPSHSASGSRAIASGFQSTDVPLERILGARTWQARFFEAAANASASIVKYSLRHQDAISAALWMDRFRFFREKARANTP